MFKSEAQDLVDVLGYVGSALAAGQPLPQAMQTLAQRAHGTAGGDTLRLLAQDLAGGATLSGALERCWPRVTPFTLALLRAGESSGQLETAVEKLHAYHQTTRRLATRLESATIYPRLVVFLALVVVLPVIAWAAGAMTEITQSMAVHTPGIWELLQHGRIGTVLARLPQLLLWPYQFGFIGWLAIAVPAWLLLIRPFGPFARFSAWVAHRMFLVGPTLRNTLAAQFADAMSLLVRAGLPMERAIALVSDFSGNPHNREQLEQITARTARGVPLSEALAACPVFPASLSWMVALGERSGRLDDSLREAARYYQGETEYMLELLGQSVEPLLLTICALVLAPAIISHFTSLLKLINNVG